METKEERRKTIQYIFNLVGSGYGEEIGKSISEDPKVQEYIDGKISLKELSAYLYNKGMSLGE